MMPHFSIIITVCDQDHKHLPHCIQSLMNQTYKEFEVIVMVDGHSLPYDPHKVVAPIGGRVYFTDKLNTCGFRQRHDAIAHAQGEYLIWLNADNLVYPTFVQSHKENIVWCKVNPDLQDWPTEERLPPVTVVCIDYWLKDHYWGVLPRASDAKEMREKYIHYPNSNFRCGNIDLLNYCLPKVVALRVDAFNSNEERIPEADWLTFERAIKIAPVVMSPNVVGCHF